MIQVIQAMCCLIFQSDFTKHKSMSYQSLHWLYYFTLHKIMVLQYEKVQFKQKKVIQVQKTADWATVVLQVLYRIMSNQNTHWHDSV